MEKPKVNVLCSFGSRTKIVAVRSCEDMTAACLEAFNLGSNHLVEVFASEWGQWVELSDAVDIGSKTRVRIIQSNQAEADCDEATSNSRVSVASAIPADPLSISGDSEILQSRTPSPDLRSSPPRGLLGRTPERDDKWVPSQPTTGDGTSASPASDNIRTPERDDNGVPSQPTTGNDTSASPASDISFRDLDFSGLPEGCLRRLKGEGVLDNADVKDVVNYVFEAFVAKMKTFYPTETFGGYKHLASELITLFPNLRQGKSFGDACEIMRMKLVHKFKNSRKRRASDSPLLQEQREAKKCSAGKSNGMPGYLGRGDGDPIETTRLMNKLKQANGEDEQDLMNQLFGERRRLIVNKKRSLTDIKRQFPLLFSVPGLWREMQLITGRNEGREEHLAKLEEVLSKIAQHTECEKGNELQSLLTCLDLDLSDVVCASPNPGTHPVLVGNAEEVDLLVEHVEVVAGMVLREALLLHTAAHCVFAQKYGSCRNLVVFLERAIFGITSTYVPRRVKAALLLLEK